VTFTAAASDPDGSIASWTWTFGDGAQASGSGPPPAQIDHTYLEGGGYNARLTVTDDQGNTFTTAFQRVNVSGDGSKSVSGNGVLDACTDSGATAITIDVTIPSWAQNPALAPPNPPAICDGRTEGTATITEIATPPSEPNDAHGARPKTVRITIPLTDAVASPGAGSYNLTVTWD
jgi:hypothetical protein